jgi:D-alanyl-D-alanine carboxypeptidase/D-alanyl-D-alanine-endopeptidase (penicillin-binding protein 4)
MLTGCAKVQASPPTVSPPAVSAPVASPPAAPAPPVAAPPPRTDPSETLRQEIAALTARPGVQHAIWGVAVRSLDRNERLFDLNPATLLVPASTAKLVSVASAVDAVGWNYRFTTILRTHGVVSNGVLHGDLVAWGNGDPSIGGRGGNDLKSWVDELKAAGIHRIDGRVIADDNAIEEPRPALAWAWDDLGYPTGALFGALNYAENRLTIAIAPAATEGGPTSLAVEGVAADRPLTNRTTTGPKGSAVMIWPEQRPGEPSLTIAGSVPAGASPARLSVSAGNPTFWFASALRRAIVGAGIIVSGDAFDADDVGAMPRGTATTLYEHRSAPLGELVRPLLKNSVNLYAEAVMRLNAPEGALPTNDAALDGLRRRMAAWGIPADGQQLIDGSGLSRRDVISADTVVTVLARMHDPSGASPWMQALPVAGVDGSLETRMKGTPAEGNVRAKTGTMSNVRSLAGYATTRDGEHLAFAILVNNFEGTGAQATQAIDAIAVRLAAFSRSGRP